MKTKVLFKTIAGAVAVFALVLANLAILPAFNFSGTKAYAAEPQHYTLDASLVEGLPGVYEVTAVVGDSIGNNATIGIPSVSKQKLADMPTTESPAIITGAAVNYETKTGPTEFTPIPGAQLVAPYSYFRWSVIDEQIQEPDGSITTHKKLSGFDGSYYIIRVNVSNIIEGAGEGQYLHVKQESNSALMVAYGMEGTTYSDALGNKTGSYSLANNAAALKDTGEFDTDKETPYFDVIVLSSSKLVAGADAGQAGAPSPDIKLSFYVDDVEDYNTQIQPLDPANMPTFPYAAPDGVTYQTEQDYTKALLAKFYKDESATEEHKATSYTIMGSDLEIDCMVDDTSVTGETPEYWSLTRAIDHREYDSHTIKLICEVPVLESLKVQADAGNPRSVILDVNSFDIQIANSTEQDTAGLTISKDARLEIMDGTKTSGAELAIGNNATMVVEAGGILEIDESCTAEVEYDAATKPSGETPPTLTNGEITIQAGGRLINNGVVNIEGMEAKPLDPNQQEQQQGEVIQTDMRNAVMLVENGGVFDNYGCFAIKGTLYNMGVVNNYGAYNNKITMHDPDKGDKEYPRGIQVFWKDDVRVEGVEPGVLNIGIDGQGNINNTATLNNYGDIVVTPGTINLYGALNNMEHPETGVMGHVYLCKVTEAVVPITPTQEAPLVREIRVPVDPPRYGLLKRYEGYTLDTDPALIGNAVVEVISNGVLGKLTPIPTPEITAAFESESVMTVDLPADIINPTATVVQIFMDRAAAEPGVLAVNVPVVNGKIALTSPASEDATYQVTVISENYGDLTTTATPVITYSSEQSGQAVTWTQGTNGSIQVNIHRNFRDDTTLEHVLSVAVDGKELDADSYELDENGSLKVTLKTTFLKTLAVGKHTLTVTFDDGEVSQPFEVLAPAPAPDPVDTGDTNGGTLIWFILMMAAIAVASAVLAVSAKRYGRK